MIRISGLLVLAVTLAGCVGQNEVVFVTNTNIGINFDSTPPVLNIGYDRQEGYIGPVQENGALPPVIAKLESNLGVISPKIEQTYATGKAAVNLTREMQPPIEYQMRGNTRRVAYALTSAAVGFNITFGPNAPIPDSMHLGYKRKELSLIPLASNAAGDCHTVGSQQAQQSVVCYGSVLAQIKLDNTNSSIADTSMKLRQMFATGVAAENLAASDKDTRDSFGTELDFTPIEGGCDANCKKLRTHAAASAANKDAIKEKCQRTSNAKLPSQFYFHPTYETARAKCVSDLRI